MKLSRVSVEEQHRLPNQTQTIQIYGATYHAIWYRTRHEHWWQMLRRESKRLDKNSRGNCYASLTWNTNEYVRSIVESLVGPREHLRAIVKRWKLIYGLAMFHGTIAYAAYQAGSIDCVRK